MKFFHLCFFYLYICISSCVSNPKNPEIYEEIVLYADSVHNANTRVPPYTDVFLYGSNMAWKNTNWRDEDVAGILLGNKNRNWEGVGVNSLRPALYEDFVEAWGYDVRVNTFQYYSRQGAINNVVFIGDIPSDAHREKKQYIPGVPSESYENLYEPIWDNGENGTPVNDKNYYALYVYKLVQKYKDHVKFWEIKNEPDFTYIPECGYNPPGKGCNWWDKDPSPEVLHNLHAPIQSYIRMLRISYEVIKSVDPEAYICVGGIGYESFLDAILRNTDNPDHGKVTDRYPYKGGAWFDCLSFHIYPMYFLKRWSGRGFQYFRHSDAAVAAVENQTDVYTELLKKYGYGRGYPVKEMIITETNVPNKQVGDFIGSELAQRNYLVKLAVAAQKKHISGIYPYCPWDAKEQNDKDGAEYDYKGFYKPIPDSPQGAELRMHESGIAWRTTSKLLGERKYDENETSRLHLPSEIDGGAFYSAVTNDYLYVLWAKTTKDLSEEASASFSFPEPMNVTGITSFAWDERETEINGNTVKLTGSPVYMKTIHK